jgi:hypothetical protein
MGGFPKEKHRLYTNFVTFFIALMRQSHRRTPASSSINHAESNQPAICFVPSNNSGRVRIEVHCLVMVVQLTSSTDVVTSTSVIPSALGLGASRT